MLLKLLIPVRASVPVQEKTPSRRTWQCYRLLEIESCRSRQKPSAYSQVVRFENPREVGGRDHVLRKVTECRLVRDRKAVRLVDVCTRVVCSQRSERCCTEVGLRPVLLPPEYVHRLRERNLRAENARMRDLHGELDHNNHCATLRTHIAICAEREAGENVSLTALGKQNAEHTIRWSAS